jgi:hypothetical protein
MPRLFTEFTKLVEKFMGNNDPSMAVQLGLRCGVFVSPTRHTPIALAKTFSDPLAICIGVQCMVLESPMRATGNPLAKTESDPSDMEVQVGSPCRAIGMPSENTFCDPATTEAMSGVQ